MKTVKSKLPFGGFWFVFTGGDTAEQNNHHGNRAQNFAYDFVKIDAKRQSHKNDGQKNSDYYAFDQPVLTPRDGVVIEVVRSINDNQLGDINSHSLAGNYILIKHADTSITLLAHFKKGSIVVKENDTVTVGQLLGSCGNSGYSSEPHIHYHVQDSEVYSKVTPELTVAAHAKGIKILFESVMLYGKKPRNDYEAVFGDLLKNC